MKRFFKSKTTVLVVVSSCVVLAASCVNRNYELSEEKINTNVTVFQEGLSLPLGSTAPVVLKDLYDKLDPEFKEFVQNKDGKYGFSYSGSFDLTDSLANIKEMLSIPALSIDENFTFDLSDVNLDGVKIDKMEISVDPIDVSGMLDIPEFDLPSVSKGISLEETLPTLQASTFDLDFESMEQTVRMANVDRVVIDAADMTYIKAVGLDTKEYTYAELKAKLDELRVIRPNLPVLPDMNFSEGFTPISEEIAVAFSLPGQIQAVHNVELNSNSKVRVTVSVENSLFTSGEIELDVDMSQIFGIQNSDGHIVKGFNISGSNAPVDYNVTSLKLAQSDWKDVNGKLILDKKFNVSLAGQLKNAKTTLNHLCNYPGGSMKVTLAVEFLNFAIDNVEMALAPITIEESFDMDVKFDEITLPEMVREVSYVDLANPLEINMQASLPASLRNSLNLELESLSIDFPDELVVNGKNGGTVTYTGRPIAGFSEKINITRINLPAPVNGKLSYNKKVSGRAVAKASGTLNSRDLIGQNGKVRVDVNVSYAPELSDYSVKIDDYKYTVDIDPITINEELPDAVGDMSEIKIYLENNPKITISLDYPESDIVNILPDNEKGLKIYFPKMIRFGSMDESYNFDAATNSISFTGNTSIPKNIVLPIEYLLINPVKVGENYYVQGEMKVEGGVRLAGTTVKKSDVDNLVSQKAQVAFSAQIPELKPASLEMGQYVSTFSESVDFDLGTIEGLPEMIKLQSIDTFELDNVYLNLSVDASSVSKLLEGVEMSMDLEVKLPELIKVEGAGEGNVIRIVGEMNKECKLEIKPVRVYGLGLSGFDFSQSKIELGSYSIVVNGNVNIENVSIDLSEFKDNLNVAIKGSLATKDTDLIKIGKVQAKVDCKYELDQSFDLSSLTESITESLGDKLDYVLDLNRFHIDLDLKTNLSVPVELSELAVVPYKGGVAGEQKQINSSIALNTSASGEVTHSKIRISNLESDKHADPEYNHVVLDVLSLIKDMPDSIKLHLKAGTKDNAAFVINPSVDYVLAADYAFELPFELGKDFKIEFNETIDELPEVLGDILAYGSLGLTGEVTNSFPIALDLEFQLLDVNGNVVPLSEGSGHQTIKAGNMDGTPSKTALNIVLGIQRGIEIPQLDAVKLTFRATSSGAGFAEDNFIQVQLSALIPEGVSADINNLTGGEQQR